MIERERAREKCQANVGVSLGTMLMTDRASTEAEFRGLTPQERVVSPMRLDRNADRPAVSPRQGAKRRSRWGHIANPGYDLGDDPHKSVNLWNDAGAQMLRAELTERLARAMLAGSDSSPYPTALA